MSVEGVGTPREEEAREVLTEAEREAYFRQGIHVDECPYRGVPIGQKKCVCIHAYRVAVEARVKAELRERVAGLRKVPQGGQATLSKFMDVGFNEGVEVVLTLLDAGGPDAP